MNESFIKVLGIDVGYDICGWSVVQFVAKSGLVPTVLDFGTIETYKLDTFEKRLLEISEGIDDIISEYSPMHLAIEDIYFFKNQKTFMKVAQVRGAIILAGMKSKLQIFNYTPLQVKQSITGYGRAEKINVQAMVAKHFNLSESPKQDDAADALAVAFCHISSYRF